MFSHAVFVSILLFLLGCFSFDVSIWTVFRYVVLGSIKPLVGVIGFLYLVMVREEDISAGIWNNAFRIYGRARDIAFKTIYPSRIRALEASLNAANAQITAMSSLILDLRSSEQSQQQRQPDQQLQDPLRLEIVDLQQQLSDQQLEYQSQVQELVRFQQLLDNERQRTARLADSIASQSGPVAPQVDVAARQTISDKDQAAPKTDGFEAERARFVAAIGQHEKKAQEAEKELRSARIAASQLQEAFESRLQQQLAEAMRDERRLLSSQADKARDAALAAARAAHELEISALQRSAEEAYQQRQQQVRPHLARIYGQLEQRIIDAEAERDDARHAYDELLGTTQNAGYEAERRIEVASVEVASLREQLEDTAMNLEVACGQIDENERVSDAAKDRIRKLEQELELEKTAREEDKKEAEGQLKMKAEIMAETRRAQAQVTQANEERFDQQWEELNLELTRAREEHEAELRGVQVAHSIALSDAEGEYEDTKAELALARSEIARLQQQLATT